MTMFKRILIVLIVLIIAVGAVVLGNGYFNFWPELNSLVEAAPVVEKVATVPAEPPKVASKAAPVVDGAVLLERYEASQQHQPNPEEIAEEQAFEAEQVEEAQQWLKDLAPEQRVAGIEQLAAFPSTKAEQLMVERLKQDASEDVRIAAADNLSYIEVPSTATQDALILALQDKHEDVRSSAFNTLQAFVASLEDDDPTAKRIVGLLRKQVKSQQVPAATREEIKEYLTDQFEN
jgi:hypothetical protein